MKSLRLAYRDEDRTPVIFCIKEMAARHYGLDVEVIKIKGTEAYEAALFDGACDVIIEHLEYLYEAAARGRKVAFLCAPSKGASLELVVPAPIRGPDGLRGGTLAVRPSGQPYAVTLWLRMMGLDKDVAVREIADSEVGRWGQWKTVAAGDCVGTFTSRLYLPDALAAGLKVLDVPSVPIIGHYAQACLATFAAANGALLQDYMKAVIHGVCLLLYRRDEALEIAAGEPMKRMGIESRDALGRQLDSIAAFLKPKPFPTPEAVANTYEIATVEYPGAAGINPLALWDLHWVKALDDAGFIDGLVKDMVKE